MVTYTFTTMTQEQAEIIAYNWYYEGEYSFYNMTEDQEDLEEFLDPNQREGSVFSVMKNNELFACFSVKKVTESTFGIGLGMRPALTGSGRGEEFLRTGIDFIKSNYEVKRITLAVATFNKRAIKVYRKVGFKDRETFMQNTNGGSYEFLRMELDT